MTDAELWGEIAEMMEGSGRLPDTAALRNPAGLCGVLLIANVEGILDLLQYDRLKNQLYERFGRGKRFGPELLHFFPVGDIYQRIAACRVLMKEALERDGR